MKSLELFSGAGGLAKGLELSGFRHVAFIEYNRDACRTLKVNFDGSKVFEGDVQNFNFHELEYVDIVAGGPPCQPFSLGGKHKSHNDHRDMFPNAIRAIEILKPKVFIFENVKGLLRSSFKDYFEYIILRLSFPSKTNRPGISWQAHLDELRKLKPSSVSNAYHVSWKLLNAADFGVPQTRERVFIVGVQSEVNSQFSFPSPTHSVQRLLWDKHVTGEYWERHNIPENQREYVSQSLERKILKLKQDHALFEPEHLPWQTIRDTLSGIPNPTAIHAIKDHIFKGGARSYPGHTGSDIDWPSKTIKAGGHGVPGGENMIKFRDGTVRYLTVFEAKRVQSFPDDFMITGSWGEVMRQIGNAVPVTLAKTLGDEINSLLNQALHICNVDELDKTTTLAAIA